jgi:hypothetical protein
MSYPLPLFFCRHNPDLQGYGCNFRAAPQYNFATQRPPCEHTHCITTSARKSPRNDLTKRRGSLRNGVR